ncbi:unnamed protein product [Peniophora sp. CBMAI 1063]|nr:unnamed protein product [Peniophora sp. CBMAI 1063]
MFASNNQQFVFQCYTPTDLEVSPPAERPAKRTKRDRPAHCSILASEEAANEWLAERCSEHDWKIKKSRHEVANKARAKRNVGSSGRGGRPKVWQYTEFWECQRGGAYEDRHKPDIPSDKRRPNRSHGSALVHCEARLVIRRPVGQDVVHVEYDDDHNHEVGTAAAMAESMLSKRNTRYIAENIELGLDCYSAFKKLLRLDEEMLDAISGRDNAPIPETLAIEYMDVYNACRRKFTTAAVRSRDGMESLRIWAEELRAKGYSVLFQDVSVRADGEESYVFAFASPWQKELLRDYSAISCLDSTHNTCFSANGKEEKAFLYTLVVKNLVTGKGVPAAFMISPGESQWPVSDWLSWLVKPVASGGLGYKGKRWMIDCSDAEAAAIRNAIPGAEIIVCMWHVYKAVAEQTKKLDVATTGRRDKTAANRALRDGAVNDFRSLALCDTSEKFHELWAKHMDKYAEYPAWQKYLQTEWLPKHRQWVRAYRQGIVQYGIETNNYVESWHSHLKTFYLKLMRRQRVDILLYILSRQVLPDFRREEARIRLGFARPALCARERQSRDLADEIPSIELGDMVRLDVGGDENASVPDILVMSFTRDPEVWYEVSVCEIPGRTTTELLRPVIAKCSCPAYAQTLLSCKHMYLAARFALYSVEPAAHIYAASAEPAAAQLPPPPPQFQQPQPLVQPLSTFDTSASLAQFQLLPDTNMPAADLAKDGARTRAITELAKIAELSEQLGVLSPADFSKEDIGRIEAQATSMRRDLTALLQKRPLYARQRS